MCASPAIIPIISFTIHSTTLLCVLYTSEAVFFTTAFPILNYMTTCASAAVIFTTTFLLHLTTLDLLRSLVNITFYNGIPKTF